MIVITDTDAAGGDQQVDVICRQHHSLQLCGVIGRQAEWHGHAAGLLNQCRQRGAVDVGEAPRRENFLGMIQGDHFVAGREDPHSWAAMHHRVRHRQRGQERQLVRTDDRPARQRRGAASEVTARTSDVCTGVAIVKHRDVFGAAIGVFLANHRVGVGR